MYVIIKGCVKQYEQKLTSYNEKIMVNFTSHYEGSNFGEVQGYTENQKKGKRYHSIETTEKCTKFLYERLCPQDIERLLSRVDIQLSIGRLREETQRLDGILHLQRNIKDDGHSAYVYSRKAYPPLRKSVD